MISKWCENVFPFQNSTISKNLSNALSGDKIRLLCAFFEVKQVFRKIEKDRSQKKNLPEIGFFRFIFSKNLFNFKKAQRSRILSPEALIECIRKVFVYTLLLKRKQYSWPFWTHRIRPCLEHKNTFFSKKPISDPYRFYQKPSNALPKTYGKQHKKSCKKLEICFFRKIEHWTFPTHSDT